MLGPPPAFGGEAEPGFIPGGGPLKFAGGGGPLGGKLGGPWPGGKGGGPNMVSIYDEEKEIKHYLQRDLEAVHSNLEVESQEAYHWKGMVVDQAFPEESQGSLGLQVGKGDEL
jgi:hypothetical protein